MTTTPHKNAPLGQRHPSIDIEFDDATERNAVTLTSDWKYRCACQLDTGACYIVLPAGAGFAWVKWCDGAVSPDPASILGADLFAWWRSDTLTQSSNLVSQITDKGTGGYNLVQATGGSKPAYTASDATLGNLPTIAGDGADDSVISSGIVIPASYTLWTIMKQTAWTVNSRLFGSGASGVGAVTVLQRTSTPIVAAANVSTYTPDNSGWTLNTWKRLKLAEGNTTSDLLKVGSVVSTGTALGRTATTNQFALFANFVGGANSAAAWAETIIASGSPTSDKQNAIEAYLVARYGSGVAA